MALRPSDELLMSFNKAFERLRDKINAEDARTFASTTMQDVWNAARRIERQLEARRSLRSFNRIQKFLAGIEQYSKIVEVLCNQTPYLPYVWAPIKLFLEISQANLSALEKLIDAYSMIGEAMPRFDKLSTAFKDDQDFQQVLGQFYEDILEFHRRAYKFFRRRAWKIVFESLWKTFDSRFRFILENLKKHRDLIDQEVNAANIVEAKAWRNEQLEDVRRRHIERAEDMDRMERERMAFQVREAATWLGANEEQEDTLARLLRAQDCMDTHWSLATPTILSWIEQGRENLFLWLYGKPGAGKSVICSRIIEHIQEETEMTVLFYFCHHFQTSKELTSEVLRSFTTQLLTANSELAPFILDTFVNNGRKPTKKNLAVILEKLIASSGPIRFVVDGLDEWSQIDQEDLIKDLFRIKGPSPGTCKVLLSSRRTAHLTKLLQSEPTFRLEDYEENISANIASFVREPLERLRCIFERELIDELEDEILKKADSMFLWVRLILYTLEELNFESDVTETIKTLPNGLDALYERILSRICGNGCDPRERRSIRILQWMLVAQRPLKRAELESGIILDDHVHQITLASKGRGYPLNQCFPLIEFDEDPSGYVNFCHFTALEFLQKRNTYAALEPAQAQFTVSLSCVLYLPSSLIFVDPTFAVHELRDQVIQGFHELLLYACDHWLDHLRALVDIPIRLLADQSLFSSLHQGLESLSQLHDKLAIAQDWTYGQQTDSFPSSRDDFWDFLGVSLSVRKLLNQGMVTTTSGSTMAGERAVPSDGVQDPTIFTRIRARYKIITEDIMNVESSADGLTLQYRMSHSSGSYLCSSKGCPRASQGFNSPELRQEHEESHQPRFQCSFPACGSWNCSSEAALGKHIAKYHNGQDVSRVPNSLNGSFRGPQERSLFRLAAPRTSLVQKFTTNERLAGTRTSDPNTVNEDSPALPHWTVYERMADHNQKEGFQTVTGDKFNLVEKSRKRRLEQIMDENIERNSQVKDGATPNGISPHLERSGQRQGDLPEAMVDKRRERYPMQIDVILNDAIESVPGMRESQPADYETRSTSAPPEMSSASSTKVFDIYPARKSSVENPPVMSTSHARDSGAGGTGPGPVLETSPQSELTHQSPIDHYQDAFISGQSPIDNEFDPFISDQWSPGPVGPLFPEDGVKNDGSPFFLHRTVPENSRSGIKNQGSSQSSPPLSLSIPGGESHFETLRTSNTALPPPPLARRIVPRRIRFSNNNQLLSQRPPPLLPSVPRRTPSRHVYDRNRSLVQMFLDRAHIEPLPTSDAMWEDPWSPL